MSDSESDISMVDETEVEEKEEITDLTNPDVVTKYRLAGEIANNALQLVISKAKPGKLIVELCEEGDRYITAEAVKHYKANKIERGIAFPTCVSLNNIVGHFSPLAGDTTVLKEGDVAKIDLGVHIDGYIAVVGHTILVSERADAVFTGRSADAVAAAHTAAEVAVRYVANGNKNNDLTALFGKIAETFKVNMVQGVLSHQMKRYVIDGNKVIIARADIDHKVEDCQFETNEVYSVDIVVSTGEGKPRELNERTTVFKRAVDQNYSLKMKASRALLSEINKRFPSLPFTLRAFEEKGARFGIKECATHDLVVPYPVLEEREGSVVVHLKFTVLLMPAGNIKITGLNIDTAKVQTQFKIEDAALLEILAKSAGKKKKKKSKAKKAGVAESKEEDMEDE